MAGARRQAVPVHEVRQNRPRPVQERCHRHSRRSRGAQRARQTRGRRLQPVALCHDGPDPRRPRPRLRQGEARAVGHVHQVLLRGRSRRHCQEPELLQPVPRPQGQAPQSPQHGAGTPGGPRRRPRRPARLHGHRRQHIRGRRVQRHARQGRRDPHPDRQGDPPGHLKGRRHGHGGAAGNPSRGRGPAAVRPLHSRRGVLHQDHSRNSPSGQDRQQDHRRR